jgi:[CysO sulfur-carrier protein]-S-L-cysteine hydrolase
MQLAQSLIDEIVAHAREEAPNECCGLLAGHGDDAEAVVRARNLHESPRSFEVADMPRLLAAIENDGMEHIGTYHSHTRSGAYPSQTDVNLAEFWPGLIWVICSLETDAPVVRAFKIEGPQVHELPVEA